MGGRGNQGIRSSTHTCESSHSKFKRSRDVTELYKWYTDPVVEDMYPTIAIPGHCDTLWVRLAVSTVLTAHRSRLLSCHTARPSASLSRDAHLSGDPHPLLRLSESGRRCTAIQVGEQTPERWQKNSNQHRGCSRILIWRSLQSNTQVQKAEI